MEDVAMSTRERWIVYPLLFLTLGIVMRDKYVSQGHFGESEVTAERIHCGQLQVDQVEAAGGIAVRNLQCSEELRAGKLRCDELMVDKVLATKGLVVPAIRCNELVVDGPNGRPTIIARTDPTTKGGSLITLSPAGAPLILLQPTDSGGLVLASEFKRLTSVARQKPQTPATPVPEKRSKTPEKTPAEANK